MIQVQKEGRVGERNALNNKRKTNHFVMRETKDRAASRLDKPHDSHEKDGEKIHILVRYKHLSLKSTNICNTSHSYEKLHKLSALHEVTHK